MRTHPRQGIFTSTPIIEYDGSWTISSGAKVKLLIPYTIERLTYRNPTATKRKVYFGMNCQQFFHDDEYPQNTKGATILTSTNLTYDAAKDIYSGKIKITLQYYAGDWTPPLTVPADETSTSIIRIMTSSSYWEQSATCRIEFRNYPSQNDAYGNTSDLSVTQE